MRALLQASKFAGNEWKSYSVEIATSAPLEDITTADRAYLAYRQSFVLRSQGREKDAQLVVEKILEALPPRNELRPLLNAIYGLLLSSLSWAYIAQAQFEKAVALCSSWTTGTSLYEMRADQRLLTARGIASKHLGRLDDAIRDLEAAFGAQEISRSRLYVLANLSDAYCENKQFVRAYDMLKLAAKKVGCYLSSTPLQDTYHRTLLLSLSEVCSCLTRYDESNAILLRLKNYFELGPCTARNDQQRHVRALLLLAQNQHRQATDLAAWLKTQELWRESISLTTQYQVLNTSGWDYAIMCLSLHHALQMVPREKEGDSWLKKANGIFLSRVNDHFWMRSLSTSWVPYMLRQGLGISEDLRSRIKICCGDVNRME